MTELRAQPQALVPNPSVLTASDEVARGERFAFGKNWQQFLRMIIDTRIRQAEVSLAQMLREPNLAGRTFLDIGCGSGLLSLAARRYEVATPEAVFEFWREHGFGLLNLRCGVVGLGCNQFVFERA